MFAFDSRESRETRNAIMVPFTLSHFPRPAVVSKVIHMSLCFASWRILSPGAFGIKGQLDICERDCDSLQ